MNKWKSWLWLSCQLLGNKETDLANRKAKNPFYTIAKHLKKQQLRSIEDLATPYWISLSSLSVYSTIAVEGRWRRMWRRPSLPCSTALVCPDHSRINPLQVPRLPLKRDLSLLCVYHFPLMFYEWPCLESSVVMKNRDLFSSSVT